MMLARRGQSKDVSDACQSRTEIGRASSNQGDKFKPYYDQVYYPVRSSRMPQKTVQRPRRKVSGVRPRVKASRTKMKLSETEKFIRWQYQKFLERILAQNQHPRMSIQRAQAGNLGHCNACTH